MTTEAIEEDLRQIVAKLMKKRTIENYEVHIDGQSESGENYMGEIVFFRVVEGTEKVHHFVMKTAKKSEELRQSCPVEMAYDRELFLYSDVFPIFRKFLLEKEVNFELDFVPKVIWIENESMKESLIFENLKTQGYRLWDRKKPWNMEHSLMAMDHYGRFHGISMALKDQKPEIFDEWDRSFGNIWEEFGKLMDIKNFYSRDVEHALKILHKNGKENVAVKYDGFIDEITSITGNITEQDDKLVMMHGDCWNNNFLFKYEDPETTKPSKISFLDFQLAFVGSPVKDLAYNIYTTCDKECLNEFDKLMKTYYASLSHTLRNLGSNPETLFTYEQLWQHWKKYGKMGLLLATVMIKMELIDKAEPPDIVKISEEGKTLDEAFIVEVEDQEEYDRRIMDVFTHYAETFL